MSVRYKNTGQN